MDRALIALCALLANALLGGPRQVYAALGAGKIAQFPLKLLRDVERKLNREQRSLEERETRGFILVLVVAGGSFMAGWFIGVIFDDLSNFVSMAILACLIPARQTWDMLSGVRKALTAGDLPAARNWLEGTLWRHHAVLDGQGVARAALETTAMQFSEKMVAVIFWYLLLGLPGAFLVASITMMRNRMAPSPDLEKGFGHATWLFYAFLQYVPARIAALLWALVSLFLPSRNWQEMSQAFFTGATSLRARPLSLYMASRVLGVSLGGPGSMYDAIPTTGPAPTPAALQRAAYLFALLCLLLLVLLGLLLF